MCLRKNAPKLDFKSMKCWWILNKHRELKLRRKILSFWLNNLPKTPTRMYKLKKSELAFALFEREILVLILGTLMFAICSGWPDPVKFLQIFWKTKVDLNKITIPPLIAHHGVSLGERRGKRNQFFKHVSHFCDFTRSSGTFSLNWLLSWLVYQ